MVSKVLRWVKLAARFKIFLRNWIKRLRKRKLNWTWQNFERLLQHESENTFAAILALVHTKKRHWQLCHFYTQVGKTRHLFYSQVKNTAPNEYYYLAYLCGIRPFRILIHLVTLGRTNLLFFCVWMWNNRSQILSTVITSKNSFRTHI